MADRLLQHRAPDGTRSVILARGDQAAFVPGVESVIALARRAIAGGRSLLDTALACGEGTSVDLAAELAAGHLIAPIDHADPAHCVMTGTGLTHLGSAEGRDKMHRDAAAAAHQTDSMRMFLEGVEGGKPGEGQVGQQPEWFYKGDGSIVAASGQALNMPDFALDGGEEPELAGLYVIGDDGQPYRVGYAIGNEFSDHVTERQNYLYLAHSKLRACGLGPALLVGEAPASVEGVSRIIDAQGRVRWEKPFFSGEQNMSHTIANLEHHHFKYPLFRRAGDVHIHFFGTATLSVADNIVVRPGETFEIEAPQFGPALRNTLAVYATEVAKVKTL